MEKLRWRVLQYSGRFNSKEKNWGILRYKEEAVGRRKKKESKSQPRKKKTTQKTERKEEAKKKKAAKYKGNSQAKPAK